jgi:hypothetical protein
MPDQITTGVIYETEGTDHDLWLEATTAHDGHEPRLDLCLPRHGATTTRNVIDLETTQVEGLMLACATWLHHYRLPRT